MAIKGVLDLSLIFAKNLKSSPSSAMAHITLGIGNMEPSRLVEGKGIHTHTQRETETCK